MSTIMSWIIKNKWSSINKDVNKVGVEGNVVNDHNNSTLLSSRFYDPTAAASKNKIEKFYNVQTTTDKICKQNILLVTGDRNTKFTKSVEG